MTHEKAHEKICPACGKPTAGYVPCPHCGADTRTRITIKLAMLLCAIVLAFGVVYFAMHLSTIEPQPTAIASIDSWMDYSYVWLEGAVSYGPQYSSTSISFEIYDGSGTTIDDSSIRVEVYDPAFKDLINENKVPRVGDNVKLFGQLRVYLDGSTEVRVSLSEDLQLTRAVQPLETTIAELKTSWGTDQSLMFSRVTLEGTVTGIRPLSSAKIYTLEDNTTGVTKELEMYIHNGLETYIENEQLDLEVLQRVRVSAGVSQYRGTPQLAISDFDEITVIGSWSPIEVPLGSVDMTMFNNFVKVGGKIIFVEVVGESDSLGIQERYLWLDNKYNPIIQIDEDVYKLLSDNTEEQMRRGATIELVGRVYSYGTEVRIKFIGPQEPSLQPGAYEPTLVENFAAIGSDNMDDLVTVRGIITYVENVARGQLPSDRRFTLEDNFGGNIKIWVPNTLYERMVDPTEVGDEIQVVGKVLTSGGIIAVQPGVLDDLQR